MVRQNISFMESYEDRIISQINLIKTKLERAEKSGFTNDSKFQILKESKSLLKGRIYIKQSLI